MIPTLRLLCALGALLGATAASATFTKIANNGSELPDSATLGSAAGDWACSRDNDSGLIWEVKTSDAGWRDVSKSYSNYDSHYGTAEQINAASNSIGFVSQVNAAALCGATGWRMPAKDELLALYPKIAAGYFPNTQSSFYWSGSPHFSGANYAWYVNFNGGSAGENWRSAYYPIRLVRDGQLFALSVTASGGGTGSITSTGIDCQHANGSTSGSCTTERGRGAAVTLTATAATGSSFTGWSGACSGSNASCSLTMDEAKAANAHFSRPTPIIGIVIDPANPATLYAGLDGAGVHASRSGGDSWSAINSGLANLNLRALVLHNSSTLYAATYDGGVFRGSLAGGNWSWQACGSLAADTRLRSLAIDASGKLYAGSEAGAFRSEDACTSWQTMNIGLPN